jgi:hypothetical protein
MSYPGPKVHRVSRRKLGRGQHQQVAGTLCSAATTTPNVTVTFASPVVVSGPLEITVGSLTIVSQSQTSPTTVVFVMSGPTTGLAYNFPAGQPNVSNMQGGAVGGTAGTF